ncbi:MAG: hypothetical protein R2715_08090 [Ilumatobacteraceae bacterium]
MLADNNHPLRYTSSPWLGSPTIRWGEIVVAAISPESGPRGR